MVPVREYLNTSLPDGDRDYVDGRIVERNVGEVEHADVHGRIYRYLCDHYPAFWSGIEVRVQVRPTRFRLPDVILVAGDKTTESIVSFPPHVAVEVLSKDDRAEEMQGADRRLPRVRCKGRLGSQSVHPPRLHTYHRGRPRGQGWSPQRC
ncbi:MAG: hypothetical protein DMG57_03680 [Acidobacteria bacterium]|nr:MAG: hypothetical protein DMG57_03680 [Acidobacteriota bacterium]